MKCMRQWLFLFVLFLFIYPSLFAQNKIEDTTTLDEVVITTHKKKKIKKIKTKGFPYYDYLVKNESVVTGITNYPLGKVKYVTFNFNNRYTRFIGNMVNKIQNNFLDVKFGLLLYEMKDDETIGSLISDSEITFFVSKDHKGVFKIDVSDLNFPKDKFFIGFKVLSKTYEKDASFYVMMCDNDENVSYRNFKHFSVSKLNNSSKFQISNQGHLKLTLSVEQ